MLLVKNLNPFSLSRKISDKAKHEMVYMIWRECIPVDFYRYICEENKFIYLNGRDVGHAGVLEIVGKFIDQKKENLKKCYKNILPATKISTNMFTRTFSLKYTQHLKDVALISRVIFTFCSNLTEINSYFASILLQKTYQIMKMLEKKQTNMNKNQLKTLVVLMTKKKMR